MVIHKKFQNVVLHLVKTTFFCANLQEMVAKKSKTV